MFKRKTQKGITLVSLVITVIILLILAGVAINLAVDGNGIFAKAKEAANKWNSSIASEEQIVANLLAGIDDEQVEEEVKKNIPNAPELVDGMTPIKFKLPVKNETTDTVGETVVTTKSDSNWYNYDEKRWANAQTEDGSMWVWIPRYAYRIDKSTRYNRSSIFKWNK